MAESRAFPSVGPALAQWNDRPPVPLDRETAVWLVLRSAQLLTGGYELGVNEGPFVRLLHRVTATAAGSAWCASFVAFCCAILGGEYPLAPHAYCPDLALDAIRLQVLARDPEVGDIILFWHQVHGEPRPRFAHTGLILAVHADGTVDTIEGNTTTDGSREGWRVCRRERRRLGDNDRVIHWHHLLRRPQWAAA